MKRHSRQHVYYQRRRHIRKRARLLRAIEYKHGWGWLNRWQPDYYWDRLIGKLANDVSYHWPVPQWVRVELERPRRRRINQLVRTGQYDALPRYPKDAWAHYW